MLFKKKKKTITAIKLFVLNSTVNQPWAQSRAFITLQSFEPGSVTSVTEQWRGLAALMSSRAAAALHLLSQPWCRLWWALRLPAELLFNHADSWKSSWPASALMRAVMREENARWLMKYSGNSVCPVYRPECGRNLASGKHGCRIFWPKKWHGIFPGREIRASLNITQIKRNYKEGWNFSAVTLFDAWCK